MNDAALLRRAAGALAHPIAITAVVVLVLNDHWWKTAYPSWLTGKLSDFAGLVFFPLLLQALVELGLASVRRYERPSRTLLVVMIAITALGFVWVKTSELGERMYGVVLGSARWPFQAAIAVLRGVPRPGVEHPDIVRDTSDLIALGGLLITYVIGRARTRDHVRNPSRDVTCSRGRDRQL
jgi:hypothetical protein